MTDREKILIALREKPLKAFEIMKRVASVRLPIALLKMRDGGAVKFDIHKGHWLDVVQVSRRISTSLRTRAIPIKKCLRAAANSYCSAWSPTSRCDKESAPIMVGRRGNGGL